MINIDKDYREAIISKYSSLDKIIDRAAEIDKAYLRDLKGSKPLIDIMSEIIASEILDKEIEEIKESIFKNDRSAYYLSAKAISILLESTEYEIETINVYEVDKNKIEQTVSKQALFGDKVFIPVCKDCYRMTVRDDAVNIITTNLVLESNRLSDYKNMLAWFNDKLKINIVTNPEINIEQLVKENNTNKLFNALKNQIIKTASNSKQMEEL